MRLWLRFECRVYNQKDGTKNTYHTTTAVLNNKHSYDTRDCTYYKLITKKWVKEKEELKKPTKETKS